MSESERGKLRRGIAEEVRALLGRRDMSRSELGRRIGISQSAISRRVGGLEPFDVDELEAVASVLGVGVADLLPSTRVTDTYRAAFVPRQRQRSRRPGDNRPAGRPDSTRRTSVKVTR